MSRPFQAFQSSFQSLPEHIKTSFATISGNVPPYPENIFTSWTNAVTENASPLEKSLRRATASPSAPLPSREDLIAMMNDHMTRGTSAQKESLKNFLAARQAALPALSDNAGAFLKQCPAFGTWHPLNILNEYNRINPGERAPSSTSMFLDDVGILPEKDRAAHAYRVDYLTQNWKRLDSIDRFLPMPINPTVSPLGEDDRMRLRLRHQMMDEADRISGQRPMKYTCAKQELAERRKAIEAAIKRDGEATGGDSAGAKEQATDEDWVVVNDMDAVEDPFVVVYDEAKFRKAG
ncbi:MAG: hypothetical protein LQ343_003901 [Gyalolechia ehrenbergii]|nr:MAG: hypothetical protein LQ343_003901 [Gyalolechia ehrenbergii]